MFGDINVNVVDKNVSSYKDRIYSTPLVKMYRISINQMRFSQHKIMNNAKSNKRKLAEVNNNESTMDCRIAGTPNRCSIGIKDVSSFNTEGCHNQRMSVRCLLTDIVRFNNKERYERPFSALPTGCL